MQFRLRSSYALSFLYSYDSGFTVGGIIVHVLFPYQFPSFSIFQSSDPPLTSLTTSWRPACSFPFYSGPECVSTGLAWSYQCWDGFIQFISFVIIHAFSSRTTSPSSLYASCLLWISFHALWSFLHEVLCSSWVTTCAWSVVLEGSLGFVPISFLYHQSLNIMSSFTRGMSYFEREGSL